MKTMATACLFTIFAPNQKRALNNGRVAICGPLGSNYLEQKFPRMNYQSTSEWVDAVWREIISISYVEPGTPKPGDELREASRQWKSEQKVAGCMIFASEILEYDFKETERLEARIAKQTRYCAELKAMEEMRNRT
jgi:hypothetical protein